MVQTSNVSFCHQKNMILGQERLGEVYTIWEKKCSLHYVKLMVSRSRMVFIGSTLGPWRSIARFTFCYVLVSKQRLEL